MAGFNKRKYIEIVKHELNKKYGMITLMTPSQWDEVISDYNGVFYILLDDPLIHTLFNRHVELRRKVLKMKLYAKNNETIKTEKDMLNQLSERLRREGSK